MAIQVTIFVARMAALEAEYSEVVFLTEEMVENTGVRYRI
jgi:hypothetical protein